MTEYLVLQDWKEYDKKKQILGEDPRYFCCSNEWEIDFLVKRVQKSYEPLMEASIRKAIYNSCTGVHPINRQLFVNTVLEKLQVAS